MCGDVAFLTFVMSPAISCASFGKFARYVFWV